MRFHTITVAAVGVAALIGTGCTSSQASGGPSLATQAATGAIGPALLQWTGTFRPKQQYNATFGGMQQRNQTGGKVTLTAPNGSQMHARIDLTLDFNDAVRLPWAIAPGGCGSNTIPLMSVPQFPEISVSNGSGTLDEVLSLGLPTAGSFHVNVYNSGTSGQDEADVLTCASLTLGRRGD
ncbi:MAG: hypothetical protein KGL38_01155 [Gemmatimonadota bacterium]|nr:hypothetical protein [Gemmatimonadota bacterium]MDE3126577.1 hypothetical protein [Gemmatimonadota bacterium]MDE3173228.1 hypothetical protein [Gemmatimonadota bacterium]MDE3216564.1 hypothetical protein [Gemmatimonadota bacterium]